MIALRRTVGRTTPLIFAHRGDSMHAPENTRESAVLGHDVGADGWELDVRLTRDGVPVVIHDTSLRRTTDVAERFADDPRSRSGFLVSEFDWAEIQQLDAGSWFVRPGGGHRSAARFQSLDRIPTADRERFQSGQVRVHTLAEALDLTRDLDWCVNIELKTFPEGGPGLGQAVADAVRSQRMTDRVLISAFDHTELHRMRNMLPEVALGALVLTPLHDSARYVREFLGANTYHPSSEALGSESAQYRADPRPENLWAEAAREVPTWVYTVNDTRVQGLAWHLAEIGVAGIFSDDPGGMQSLFQQRETGDKEQRA